MTTSEILGPWDFAVLYDNPQFSKQKNKDGRLIAVQLCEYVKAKTSLVGYNHSKCSLPGQYISKHLHKVVTTSDCLLFVISPTVFDSLSYWFEVNTYLNMNDISTVIFLLYKVTKKRVECINRFGKYIFVSCLNNIVEVPDEYTEDNAWMQNAYESILKQTSKA